MKPLQHEQISAKTYGGSWTDDIEVHDFLDSSKATCAHFKHRFLLHHREGNNRGLGCGRIYAARRRNQKYEIGGRTTGNSAQNAIENRQVSARHYQRFIRAFVRHCYESERGNGNRASGTRQPS